ncbi:MAG: hypothetical protein R6V04_03840, partial [bacterium]
MPSLKTVLQTQADDLSSAASRMPVEVAEGAEALNTALSVSSSAETAGSPLEFKISEALIFLILLIFQG